MRIESQRPEDVQSVLQGDIEFLELACQRIAAPAQQPRRFLAPPTGMLQRCLDECLLEGGQCLIQ